MKKLLLSLFAIFLVSGIYAQLDDQPLLLHLDFEDADEIALNEQDRTTDDVDATAEYSTDAKIGVGAASFDGLQLIIMDLDEALNCQTTNYSWAVWIKTDAPGGTIASWSSWSGTPAEANGPLEDEETGNDPHMAAIQALFWGFESGAPTFDVGWVDLFPVETEINDGAWHHVVLSNDVTGMLQVIYVDGEAQMTTGEIDMAGYEDPPDTPVEEFVLKIGYSNSSWPTDEGEENQYPYFTGVMDDFRMYGAALTADDVAELFALTSVEGFETTLDFAIYPNPASEYMMIRSSTPDRNLDIFNAMGQLILSEQNVQNGSMVDISDLETGLYFVKSEDSIQKLIIE